MYQVNKRLCCAIAAVCATAPWAHADESAISRVIVFGDSLSDGGFFSVDSPLPPGQGFTTNPDPVAPEVFAGQLGLQVNPFYGEGGTNYAVGGARVAAENPPSVPITAQIDAYVNSGGRFRDDDVIYIQGGGNDYFAFVAGGGNDPGSLTVAAAQLAEQVSRIQDAGGEQIVTMSVQSGGAAAVQAYNEAYEAALVARGVNALYFDTDALFNEMVQFAGDFGFTNFTDTACGDVDALYCGPANFVAPDANETYILADSVHPAGKAQRVQGQAIASLLLAPEQIGQLAYAAQSLLRSHRHIHQRPMQGRLAQSDNENRIFANLGVHDFSRDSSVQSTGVDEEHLVLGLGVDHRLAARTYAGAALGVSDGEGEFGFGRGDYQVDAASALFYVRTEVGRVQASTDLMIGRIRYDALTREVQLTPVARRHRGSTDADFFGLGAALSYAVDLPSELRFAPQVGLTYQAISIDAYREAGDQSTSARFGEQELDSLNATLGFSLTNAPSAALHFYLDAQLNFELNDDARSISMTPSGAPIAFSSELFVADEQYLSAEVGAAFKVSHALRLNAGMTTTRARGDLDSTAFFISASHSL